MRLSNGKSDYTPSWSPDERSIAFLRGVGKDAAIMVIPAIGGSARTARMDVYLNFTTPAFSRLYGNAPNSVHLFD